MEKYQCPHCKSIFIRGKGGDGPMTTHMCACCGHCMDDYKNDQKIYLINDNNIKNNLQSGAYTWSDDKRRFPYTSSYEHDFLQFLDKELCLSSDNILPSINTCPQNIIQLWGGGEYLIIKTPSGIKYSNQTGGMWCDHPIAEGVLLPLNTELGDDLEKHINFHYADFKPANYPTIDPEKLKADYDEILNDMERIIQETFTLNHTGYHVTVDRDIEGHQEAWIHLNFKKDPDIHNAWMTVFEDLKIDEFKAILTYENSD